MKLARAIAIGLVVVVVACETTSSNDTESKPPDESAAQSQASPKQRSEAPDSSEKTAAQRQAPAIATTGARPRFSADGEWLVFESETPSGGYAMFRMRRASGEPEQIGPAKGNNRHPTFDLTGERVIYASDKDGDFDLYALDLESGQSEQVTDMAGDEMAPDVSPIRYTFYAAQTDSCTKTGASGTPLDAYQKVAFTRALDDGDRTEVWFASMKPTTDKKEAFQTSRKPPVSQEHAVHSGRLSEAGEHCEAPRWSGDGLSIVWSCREGENPLVMDGPATWEQSFAAAIKAVRGDDNGKSCDERHLGNWRTHECYKELPRSYSEYEVAQASSAAEAIAQPSISANQVVLLGQKDGQLVWRKRALAGGEADDWTVLEIDHADIRYPSWDPHGYRVVYDVRAKGGRVLRQTGTDFYLQDVQNLNQFAEVVRTESNRLDQNGFVARPGDWKEFHAYYDKLRYERRPAFVTADAALQAFRDEFQRILQDAESEAAARLHELSGALYEHYWARYQSTKDATDLYYARYFAAGYAPLEAYDRLEKPDEDLERAAMWNDLDDEEQAEYDRLTAPAIERIPKTLPTVIEDFPDPVASAVSGWTESMLEHRGVKTLDVPSYDKPFKVDFSQFKVRGTYAENDKGAYFLAISWFSMAPLPFDQSLHGLQEAMKTVAVDRAPAMETWRQVDSTIGAFMGSAVDPAPGHLVALVEQDADALSSFDGDAVADALREMVGPTAIRDANSAGPATTKRAIKVTFMPKRKGLDAEFFGQLTHPTVNLRPLASALDVFAVFGVDVAVEHATAQVKGEDFAESYRKTLDKLKSEHADGATEGYAATDVYHSWMAVLVTLAGDTDLPKDSLLEFARTDAWADRKLNSALAGFAQLKHSAVLYAAQDFAAECDSSRPTYILVEQPVLPQTRGFVEPEPEFFSQLASLAGGVYEQMAAGRAPAAPGFGFNQALNAKVFSEKLAELARKQVDGEELSHEEYRWIRMVGGRLEAISLERDPHSDSIRGAGKARASQGVSLATDIQTNGVRNLVRQVAIGRLLDLYVGVPHQPGRRMTQGAAYSFYEFTRPMDKRLTDRQWNEMLESGSLPERPDFTTSFIQPVDIEWSEEAPDDGK